MRGRPTCRCEQDAYNRNAVREALRRGGVEFEGLMGEETQMEGERRIV